MIGMSLVCLLFAIVKVWIYSPIASAELVYFNGWRLRFADDIGELLAYGDSVFDSPGTLLSCLLNETAGHWASQVLDAPPILVYRNTSHSLELERAPWSGWHATHIATDDKRQLYRAAVAYTMFRKQSVVLLFASRIGIWCFHFLISVPALIGAAMITLWAQFALAFFSVQKLFLSNIVQASTAVATVAGSIVHTSELIFITSCY